MCADEHVFFILSYQPCQCLRFGIVQSLALTFRVQIFELRGETGIHAGARRAPERIIVQQGEVCFEVAGDVSGLKLRFQPDMMNTSWNLQVALDR